MDFIAVFKLLNWCETHTIKHIVPYFELVVYIVFLSGENNFLKTTQAKNKSN